MRGFRGEQASSQVPVQGLPGQISKGTGFHPNGKYVRTYVRVLPGVFGKHVFVPPPPRDMTATEEKATSLSSTKAAYSQVLSTASSLRTQHSAVSAVHSAVSAVHSTVSAYVRT